MSFQLIALEVVGFKSFREKQLIPFHSDFTAIVGPNGCGKSNIFEALFWALGESVRATLRLERAEDILFEGTSGGRFFAEVTLFLEQRAEGAVPVSLIASRRYHASGENLYFINRQEVKAALYQEILQSWGLFHSSYMLMAQGKTESLMDKAGAAELHLMLEEIVGLTELKSRRDRTLKNMAKADEHLTESSKMWVQTTVRHDQLKTALGNQAKAEELQRTLERLETQVTLLDMYRLHLKIEEAEGVGQTPSLSDAGRQAVREEQAVEMQITLTRERLKDANTALLEAQKEGLAIERLKELASHERASLLVESKTAADQLEIVQKKVKAVHSKVQSLNQNSDSQVLHLNKLLSMQDELEMRRNQLQNQLRKGLYDIVKKVPRGFRRELERMREESIQLSEFLTMNDSLIFDLVEQFLLSHRSFLTSLEQIDWEFLESQFREAYEELLTIEVSLERQNEKVIHFRAARVNEEEKRRASEQERKDLLEEETFHKNRADMIRFRREALEEKWQGWKEALAKWNLKRERAQKEGERLSRLIKSFEETHRHGKRSTGRAVERNRDTFKEVYQLQGEFLTLKKLLVRESDWNDFIQTAEESALETYLSLCQERDAVKTEFMPLRVWLSSDRMQKDYDEVADRFEQLIKEREDLEQSLAESRRILARLDREVKKRFNETLKQLNHHLKEISEEMFSKGFVQLEEVGSGLTFMAQIKGQGKKNLRAFSGGEKTLVFLSFLLAVYAVANVPFTFLDEIDAALDEENSLKWVALLSQLSQKRQLILITHNPIVARAAHQLLGVTLDKGGYTAVYSLDLTSDYAIV